MLFLEIAEKALAKGLKVLPLLPKRKQLGVRAIPYLLEDIREQHPDGSLTSKGSFWACISLVHRILVGNALEYPEIPEEDRGRLAPIRKIFVDWGVQEGFLENGDA